MLLCKAKRPNILPSLEDGASLFPKNRVTVHLSGSFWPNAVVKCGDKKKCAPLLSKGPRESTVILFFERSLYCARWKRGRAVPGCGRDEKMGGILLTSRGYTEVSVGCWLK